MTYLEYYDSLDSSTKHSLDDIWNMFGLTEDQVRASLAKKGEMRDPVRPTLHSPSVSALSP